MSALKFPGGEGACRVVLAEHPDALCRNRSFIGLGRGDQITYHELTGFQEVSIVAAALGDDSSKTTVKQPVDLDAPVIVQSFEVKSGGEAMIEERLAKIVGAGGNTNLGTLVAMNAFHEVPASAVFSDLHRVAGLPPVTLAKTNKLLGGGDPSFAWEQDKKVRASLLGTRGGAANKSLSDKSDLVAQRPVTSNEQRISTNVRQGRSNEALRPPIIFLPGGLGSTIEGLWDIGTLASPIRALNQDDYLNSLMHDFNRRVRRMWFVERISAFFNAGGAEVSEQMLVPTDGRFYVPLNDDWDNRADVFICPYDWRVDCVQSARRLREAIRNPDSGLNRMRRDATRDMPWTIICHSLGGVVGRMLFEEAGISSAEANLLITLGSPHQGLTKAMAVCTNASDRSDWNPAGLIPTNRYVEVISHFDGVMQLSPYWLLPMLNYADSLKYDAQQWPVNSWLPYGGVNAEQTETSHPPRQAQTVISAQWEANGNITRFRNGLSRNNNVRVQNVLSRRASPNYLPGGDTRYVLLGSVNFPTLINVSLARSTFNVPEGGIFGIGARDRWLQSILFSYGITQGRLEIQGRERRYWAVSQEGVNGMFGGDGTASIQSACGSLLPDSFIRRGVMTTPQDHPNFIGDEVVHRALDLWLNRQAQRIGAGWPLRRAAEEGEEDTL